MKIYLLISTIFFFSFCKQKNDPNAALNQQALQYISDYDEFIDTLLSHHPAPYEFTSKKSFNQRTAQIRSELNNSTTEKTFIWKLSETIALLGCGHTSLGFFNQQRALLKPHEYFPLLTRLIDDKLYVIDPLINAPEVAVGIEIISINGQPASAIMKDIYAHINTQAHIQSPKTRLFNAYNTAFIPYALDFPESYTIKTADGQRLIELRPLNENPPNVPLVSKKHPCQADFCLTEMDNRTALLTLRNFAYYGERTKIYTDFLDDAFLAIKQKKYQNLIIDVRGNLGGPGAASIHLLRYTLQQPFRYFRTSDFGNQSTQEPFTNNFDGKIIFVMNGEGFSTVGHLASIYQDKDRVTFIGETLGSNQFCTANQKQFELTNTNITYSVARNIFETNVKEKNSNATIEPNVRIQQSLEDFLADKDVVLEKALELAEQ